MVAPVVDGVGRGLRWPGRHAVCYAVVEAQAPVSCHTIWCALVQGSPSVALVVRDAGPS